MFSLVREYCTQLETPVNLYRAIMTLCQGNLGRYTVSSEGRPVSRLLRQARGTGVLKT